MYQPDNNVVEKFNEAAKAIKEHAEALDNKKRAPELRKIKEALTVLKDILYRRSNKSAVKEIDIIRDYGVRLFNNSNSFDAFEHAYRIGEGADTIAKIVIFWERK